MTAWVRWTSVVAHTCLRTYICLDKHVWLDIHVLVHTHVETFMCQNALVHTCARTYMCWTCRVCLPSVKSQSDNHVSSQPVFIFEDPNGQTVRKNWSTIWPLLSVWPLLSDHNCVAITVWPFTVWLLLSDHHRLSVRQGERWSVSAHLARSPLPLSHLDYHIPMEVIILKYICLTCWRGQLPTTNGQGYNGMYTLAMTPDPQQKDDCWLTLPSCNRVCCSYEGLWLL